MNHDWHLKLVRQSDLLPERLNLLLLIILAVIEVESNLADCLHLRVCRKLFDALKRRIIDHLAVLRVNSDSRITPVVLLSIGNRLLR